MLEAVIFDLDGTLVHGFDWSRGVCLDLHHASWCAVLGRHGVRLDEAEYRSSMSGRTNAECDRHVQARWRIDVDGPLSVEKERHYREVLVPAHLEFLPGVVELLDELTTRDVAVAILTNAPAENIRAVDSLLGLENWFDPARIVNGDELTRAGYAPKPAADGLNVLAERLGVSCDACIYIGDSIGDFEAARSASMAAVGIETTHEASVLTSLGARLAVPDFTSLNAAGLSALL